MAGGAGMTIGWQIARSDLVGHDLSHIGAGALAWRSASLWRLLFVLPTAAKADCDVPDMTNGIPEDVAFKADVGGTRAGLAKAGIGVGGAYYANHSTIGGASIRVASTRACS